MSHEARAHKVYVAHKCMRLTEILLHVVEVPRALLDNARGHVARLGKHLLNGALQLRVAHRGKLERFHLVVGEAEVPLEHLQEVCDTQQQVASLSGGPLTNEGLLLASGGPPTNKGLLLCIVHVTL